MTATRVPAMAEVINATLADMLAEDPRILLAGEDIGRLGGVFRVTRGLRDRFGADRVRDAVLAESSIIGSAIGMSIAGLIPICEIQFDGFVYPATNQIVTQASRMVGRWNGDLELPLVVRIPTGGGVRGVEHHSESNESLFARVPGISVACPSTPEDASQLLRHSITLGHPVVFYEPIRLYWRRNLPARTTDVPASPMAARVARTGSDLTVVTFGAVTNEVLTAAEAVAGEVDVEVIDLRWVAPIDTAAVLESIGRTGRLLIVHEAVKFGGIGAEVAATIAEDGFELLRTPIRRLAPDRVHYPPADFEEGYLVGVEQIARAIRGMVA
ncbi:alpha-ketoacid dehydrogenase subunit beta [Nocardia sp. NPDC052566]|uniref:alpha-ketoacid dehydrogenase subunit beta n=1 Tax=Nocardia sp. NPDC052566 TaxID=3364330 RepID=UPI0037C7A891